MFTGEARRRIVSKGGRSSKKDDKASVLRKAREDRRRREEERQKLRGSTLLQSAWRGFQQRSKEIKSSISALEKKCNDIERVEAMMARTGKKFTVPMRALMSLVRDAFSLSMGISVKIPPKCGAIVHAMEASVAMFLKWGLKGGSHSRIAAAKPAELQSLQAMLPPIIGSAMALTEAAQADLEGDARSHRLASNLAECMNCLADMAAISPAT